MQRITLFICALIMTSFFIPQASAERRIALVLGNNAYQDVPKLQKAVNDATALERKLKTLGFDVILGTNLKRREMVAKIQELASKISIGDKVVFFYAGHGVQIDRANLLLATDIPATGGIEEEYVRFEGFNVQSILDMIRGRGAQTTIMILDACRNNPFAASNLTRAVGGLTRGLVPIREARRGTFIMYSADEGQEAFDNLGSDDNSENSVFTRNLLVQMDNPDLELTELAKKVQVSVLNTVEEVTKKNSQAPFYVDRLYGEFYFHKRKQSDEELFWTSIKNNTNAASFKVYLQVYPDGKFKQKAKEKIRQFGSLTTPVKHAGFINIDTTALAGSFMKTSTSLITKLFPGARNNQSGLPLMKASVKNRKPIFPNSSKTMLNDGHLKQLSCLELWLARNEIYDRNGYCFTTPLGIQYFKNDGCKTTKTNILKNWTENRNVKLIQGWEKKKRCNINR